jgi:hypothetical protein
MGYALSVMRSLVLVTQDGILLGAGVVNPEHKKLTS